MNNSGRYNQHYERVIPSPKKRQRVSTKHKVIFAVILVIYTVILSAVTYVLFYKPKNEDKTFVGYETDEHGNTYKVEYDYVPTEGTNNILLLGRDKNAMLTDVIMLMNIDNNDKSITLMQIPRDTYVTSVDGVPIASHKANELFSDHYNSHLKNGESEDEAYKNALDDVRGLLEDSLCISINSAAIMDLIGFKNIVDAIGGVEMDVPNALYYSDPEQGLVIDIPAGYQTLNGDMAEGFVRYRKGFSQADLGRVNAQKLFMVAFFNKVKSSISITNIQMITNLAEEVISNVVTDVNLSEVIYYAKSVIGMDLSGIKMLTLPGQLESTRNYYILNRAATLDILNENFNIYDKDITTSIFDSEGQFNNVNNDDISYYYYATDLDLYDDNVYSGDSVDDNGIDIPMIY